MTGSKVVAFGHFQPERIVPNTELEKLVETSDEWITRRVGIEERRWGTGVETVDSMAIKAAEMAFGNSADIKAADIDLIVVATCTATDRSPS